MSEFSFEACETYFSIESDSTFPAHITLHDCEVVHGSAETTIALLEAFSFNRFRAFESFHWIIERGGTDRVLNFPLELFDNCGLLHSLYVDNEYHRGSGCWGREMDDLSSHLYFISRIDTFVEVGAVWL